MANLNEKNARLANKRRQTVRRRGILAVLACIVAIATATALMVPAVSMTKGELTCGIEEHSHGDACFEKVLVCGQEESGGHAHSDACFEKVLACGQEEGDDHAHTDACYEKVLTCGQEESEGHAHSDACYESQLTCDKPEHTHTDACYTHEQVNAAAASASSAAADAGSSAASASASSASADAGSSAASASASSASADASSSAASASASSAAADASSSAASASASSAAAASSSAASASASSASAKMPAADFEKKVERADASAIKVKVKAPEGAFPEGTTMEAKLINADDVKAKVEDAVLRENGEDVKIKNMTAVDIVFKDKDGKEIEPAKAVQVKITSDDIDKAKNLVLVHVLDKNKESSKGNPYDAESVAKVKIVNENDDDYTVGTENTMKFESKAFSPYVITELESAVTTPAQTFDLSGTDGIYEVTVSYGPEAEIPENVHLEVTALAEDSDEYAEAKDAVVADKQVKDEDFNENNLGFAALDISIKDDSNNVIEPADGAEVTVSIKVKELPESVSEEDFADTLEIQHLNESTGTTEVETVAQSQDMTVAGGTAEAEFTIDSFSTFTITWSNAANSSTNLTLRQTNNNNVGQVTCNYVNSNGYAITRPAGVGGNVYINNVGQWPTNYPVEISPDNVARAMADRTYEKAYIIYDGEKKDITRILFTRTSNTEFKKDYYNDENLVASVSGTNVNGNWSLPVYLQYSGTVDANDVTLHFVDDQGTELTGVTYTGSVQGVQDIINSEGTIGLTTLFPSNGTLDLTSSFTIEGYTFSNSYINKYKGEEPYADGNGVPIGNELNRNNNQFNYRTRPGSNGTTDLKDGDQIYLVYSPIGGGSGGGGGGGGGETPDLGKIGNSKAVTSNNDGTYNVALTVSGSAQHKTEETDINVVFIIDCSNSMVNNGVTRLRDTKIAVNAMAEELLRNNTVANPDAVELALTQFNNHSATISLGGNTWTTDYTTFSNAVNNDLETHQGTNWEAGLQEALGAVATASDGDPTYVIFFTDGQPTNFVGWNQTNPNQYYNSYYEWDYWPARDEARRFVYDGNILYCIYAYGTDDQYLRNLVKYAYNSDTADATYYYLAQNSSQVDDVLKAILKEISMNFAYANVSIDDGVTGLSSTTLTNVDTSSLTYKITYKDYTSSEAYTTKTITTEENEDGYKLTVNSDGTLSIPAVTYHVLDKDADNNPIVKEITTSAVTITGVTFTDSGVDAGKTVSWDMDKVPGGPDDPYMLEDGWTYCIDFTVWPSQEAFDLVAALNNEVINWGDDYTYTTASGTTATILFDVYKDQVEKDGNTYSLKTNTGCVVTYQQVTATTDEITGETTYEYGDVKQVPVIPNPEGHMGLESTTMNVEKAWDDSINTRNRANYVDFYLKIDGKYYLKDGTESAEVPSDAEAYLIPVTNTGKYSDGTTTYSAGDMEWINSVYIAPGVMTTADGVLETGHHYTIVEKSAHKYEKDSNGDPNVTTPDSYQTYSMDFTSQTVRPMEVDGTLQYLILVDDDNLVPPGAQTYNIDSKTYFVSTSSTAGLTATNHKTPEFDITKSITDTTGKTTAELNAEIFTYTVTITLPEDATNVEKDGTGYWIYEPSTSDDSWKLPEYAEAGAGYAPYGWTADAKYYGDSKQGITYNGNTATVTVQMHRTDVIRFVNLPVGTTYQIVEAESEFYNPVTSKTTSTADGTSASGRTINGVASDVNTRYYNQYDNTVAKPFVHAQLDVKKELEGFDWIESDEFTFTLAPVGDAPMPLVKGGDGLYTPAESVVVTATQDSRVKTFGNIRYTAAGSYQYTITETAGDAEYIDYATDPVTVTVTVEEEGDSLVVKNIASTGTTTYTPASDEAFATGVTTITNAIKQTDADATKQWLDANGEPFNPTPGTYEVTFQLYKKVGTADPATMGDAYKVTLDGEVDQAGEATAWVASFSNLPAYEVTTYEGERTFTEITYYFDETKLPSSVERVPPFGPVANHGTIQNKLSTLWVQFVKIGESDNDKLPGATFTFNDGTSNIEMTSGEDGIMVSGTGENAKNKFQLMINDGDDTYDLTETVAPNGYNKLEGTVNVSVKPGQVTWTQNGSPHAATEGSGTENDPYVVVISNSAGTVLPTTGGTGTAPFTLGGIALVVIAACVYGFGSRRGRERGSQS